MVAVGITSKGNSIEFECNDILFCSYEDLVSLEVPEGVKKVWCRDNKLTKLKIPESVTMLICDKEIIGLEEFIGEIYIELW